MKIRGIKEVIDDLFFIAHLQNMKPKTLWLDYTTRNLFEKQLEFISNKYIPEKKQEGELFLYYPRFFENGVKVKTKKTNKRSTIFIQITWDSI